MFLSSYFHLLPLLFLSPSIYLSLRQLTASAFKHFAFGVTNVRRTRLDTISRINNILTHFVLFA